MFGCLGLVAVFGVVEKPTFTVRREAEDGG